MQFDANKLTFLLAVIASVLAFAAAAVDFFVSHKVSWMPIAGGLVMLTLAFGAQARRKRKTVYQDPPSVS